LNFALPLGIVMLFATVEDFVVVSTILFRLNMSEASRIMSPYLEEEGIADAERAGPPRADKFPAFNAARSIASARRRADNEFAFCSGALLLPGCCFEEEEEEEEEEEAAGAREDARDDVTRDSRILLSVIFTDAPVGVDFRTDLWCSYSLHASSSSSKPSSEKSDAMFGIFDPLRLCVIEPRSLSSSSSS
jgi:hypothetical protein